MHLKAADLDWPGGQRGAVCGKKFEPGAYCYRHVAEELELVAAGLVNKDFGNAAVFPDAPAIHAPPRSNCEHIVVGRDRQRGIVEVLMLVSIGNASDPVVCA